MGKEKATAVATEAEELPKTIVRRVVKEKLSQISTDGGDVTLHKEALIAFSESARIFIHYLSATYSLSLFFSLINYNTRFPSFSSL